ncbi:MAG: flagellar basal body P-ring formation chaperone FlgA [Deferribacteraceae bacterium]|jgi:flagella basal body P-ring formation protein FlgA|nr:flagellar basal body P-ring formation chaperone FlgA [Deferribacteraceae bacterium]
MKKIFIAAIFTMYAFICSASFVEINGECVHLYELLGDEYPASPVQCGFQPGDQRLIPLGVINAVLKRSGLPAAAESSYTVYRAGYKLSEEVLRQELTALYTEKYTDKEISVESVHTGRDIFIMPGMVYKLDADLGKFGSVQGYVKTGTVRNSFTYVVKAFEEGYVTSEKVLPGDNLVEKTVKMRIDVSNLRGELLKEPKDQVASRSFPKGRVLTTDMVEPRPERVKGDTVLIIYNKGNVRLEISGIAEGNAVIGKSFLVRNPSSGAVLSAIYEGNGRAVVN